MEQSKWKMPHTPGKSAESLLSSGYSPLLSAVLLARGIDTPEKAAAFLGKDEALLSDPLSLIDMEKALVRIGEAITSDEFIAVYGDYDVDGITASCLLYDYLSQKNVRCMIYIPDRIDEGYGLNAEALSILKSQGVGLVVTVDCGITAIEETEFAKSIGLDIIITDHHECPDVLPPAYAVIDPKRQDQPELSCGLAGVGVAFKLACALEGDTPKVLEIYADLVAVGTVADVMPLTGENRVLVSRGLEKLKSCPRPGFAALLEEAGAANKPLSASMIGFTLAPRINAAGRLCQTSKSIELLTCGDPRTASERAMELCELNRQRQELEQQVWQESIELLEKEPPDGPIVLASESWHSGVVGIAASRLAEEFKLPAVMICLEGEHGKGSCRSYGSFNIFDGLAACSGHLESFGGHAFAAGLNIKKDEIDEFRRALTQYYNAHPSDSYPSLEPEVLLTDLSLLTMEDVASLDTLEPCGSGNPKPLFCLRDVRLETLASIGGGKHVRMRISKYGKGLDCVFFSHGIDGLGVCEGELIDLCFTPQINEFRSHRSVQLLVADIRKSERLSSCKGLFSQESFIPELFEGQAVTRRELAFAWRWLKNRGGHSSINISELFSSSGFESIDPVELCLSIKVFAELSLLSHSLCGDRLEISLTDNGEKAQLENSSLFRKLARE